MNAFEQHLNARLGTIREQGLHRELRRVDSPQGTRIVIEARELLNFSSNDYLGLANHPALREAAIRGIEAFGAGSGGSRLICGSLAIHHELEEALAAFKGAAAALSFSSGYAAAIGTICALLDKNDVIVIDKLVHASLVDAARLCGAKLRVFAHNDLNDLDAILKWAAGKVRTAARGESGTGPRILIVTESVFSMDGDLVPLRQIVEMKEKYGAWLMLDEAHATGVVGEKRRGLADADGVADRIEIQMGTLGKALGSAGGYICGSRALIDFLNNRARSFIFSTAPVPAVSAAAKAAVELVRSDEGKHRREILLTHVGQIADRLNRTGWAMPPPAAAILPLHIGDHVRALEIAAVLRERGIFIPAIRFPTVARGEARLRLTVTAAHTTHDLDQLFQAFASINLVPGNP